MYLLRFEKAIILPRADGKPGDIADCIGPFAEAYDAKRWFILNRDALDALGLKDTNVSLSDMAAPRTLPAP